MSKRLGPVCEIFFRLLRVLISHFSAFQISAEQEVLKKMGELREKIPKVKPGQKTKFQDDIVMLNELLQVRNGIVRQF